MHYESSCHLSQNGWTTLLTAPSLWERLQQVHRSARLSPHSSLNRYRKRKMRVASHLELILKRDGRCWLADMQEMKQTFPVYANRITEGVCVEFGHVSTGGACRETSLIFSTYAIIWVMAHGGTSRAYFKNTAEFCFRRNNLQPKYFPEPLTMPKRTIYDIACALIKHWMEIGWQLILRIIHFYTNDS